METFKQLLKGPVWDGDLVSKIERDMLKEAGFIDRGYGFNYVTTKGVEAAVALGMLKRGTPVSMLPFSPTPSLPPTVFGHHMRATNELDDYADVHRANTQGTAYSGTTGE